MAKKKKNYNLILYELQQEALKSGKLNVTNEALQKQAQDEYLAPIRNVNLGRRYAEQEATEKKANKITQSTSQSKKTSSTKNSSKAKESTNKSTWLSKGAFSDGYQIGDITKTLLGTAGDIGAGAAKGMFRIGEGLGDLASYGVAGIADLLGNDDYADRVRRNAATSVTDNVFKSVEDFVDPYSVIGEKGDSISEGLGYVGAILATGGVAGAAGLGTVGTTAVTTGLTGFSSMGSGMSEAYQAGATDEEALKYGIISGVAEAGSELIFGGLGKAVNAVGLSKGLSSLDDALAKKISSKLTSTLSKNLAEYTVKAGAEGVEEVISGIAQGIGKKMTYMSDEELVQILKDENLLEQFIVGTVTSSIAQAPGLVKTTNAGRDFISNYTQNEQKVVDAEVENRVNEQQARTGKELTNKEISKIREEVEQDFEKGYISTDTIENTLGKKLTAEQETEIEAQLNTLLQQGKTATDPKQIAELDQQMDTLATQLQNSRSVDFSNDAYIQKSYQEKALRKEHYTYEATDNEKVNKLKESASKYMNNTTRTHEMVDTVAKLVQDTDKQYEFINTEGLKEAGYNVEGKKVNGLVDGDRILINIDNDVKLLETVIGHETTHLLEGTQEYQALQDIAIEYAKTKGIYNDRIANLESVYKGTNADINAELTSDLTGELLFTDQSFIDTLSKEQPNVFQKIYNYIKHVYKMATAGSKEARQLEELKYKFDQAYKKAGKQTSTDTKYSFIGEETTKNNREAQEALRIAKRMYDSKIDMDSIRQNTGWFKGTDGNWKAEVDDSNAKLVKKLEKNREYRLGDILKHDDLYSFIPEYKNLKVVTTTMEANGSFNPKTGLIKLNNNNLNNAAQIESTLLHELQHATQTVEGWKDGTNLKNAGSWEAYENNHGEKEAREVQARKNMSFEDRMGIAPSTQSKVQYSLDTDGKMVDNKGNEVKLEATEAGTHGTLMAIHNLDASKIKGILELGGFPVPSIAVLDTNKVNHTQFGQISVIFDSSTIDPKNKKNEVYDRDIWSPTFPQVDFDINNAALNKMINENNIYSNYRDDIAGQALNRYFDSSNLETLVDRYGLEGTLTTLKDSEVLKYLYLQTINNGEYQAATKEKKFSYYESNEALKRFIDNYKGEKSLNELSYDETIALQEDVINAITETLPDDNFKKDLTEIAIKQYTDNYSKLNTFIYDASTYKRALDRGEGIPTEIDKDKTFANVEEEINQEAFEKWVDDTFGNMFANTKKGIRNSKDLFTPSGNRRSFNQLHDEYNLENIVKAMTKQSTIAGQKGLFEGGFGKTSAHLATKFKSIKDIKNAQSRLTNEETAKEVVQPLADQLNEDMKMLLDYHKKDSSYKSDFVSGLEAFEHISGAVEEFAGKNLTIENFRKVLDSWYSFNTNDIPDSVLQKIIDDLNLLKEIPTDYFEAKPQRAVGLDEVQAIVVPNDISSDLKQQLYDRGLNVIEYDPNIEGDRTNKINELDDLKFSLSAENEVAPIGQRGTYGKDVRLEIEEAIAPLQETINNLSEQLETVLNSNEQVKEAAPIQEVQPTQPTLEEVQNLIDIRDNKSGSEYARAFFALRDKYGQVELYKSLNEYYSTGTVTQPSTDIDTAPVSQDIVEKQGQENFEHLPESEMPPEINEEDFAPIEDTYEDASSPVQERDIDEVGNRKVKAYQYEHPEVRPYFQVEADHMLGELSRRIEGERFPIIGQDGYTTEWTGVSRQIPEFAEYLKDNYRYTYEQIEKGLKAIIEDDGAENNAVSKRLEILIDERLTNGYVDFLEGYPIPPNQAYKNMLIENDAADYYSNLAKTLDDADFSVENTQIEETTKNMPLYEKIEPLKSPTTRENTTSQQTIPMKLETAQNGNTGVTEGKQRKWVETSTESEVVNREILPDDLDQTKIFYQPITNRATLGKANVKLDTFGYEKAVEYFNNQVLNKDVKVEDIVLGERLIQEAIKNKDTKTAGELIQNVAILGTELGQKVQALSIIQRMTPEGQLKMLEKTINRGKTKGDQAFTDVNLTQEMKDKILNTYNEDGSYNQDELNKAVDEVKQQIADQMPSTMMDKINDWRYFSMLGNPKTHIRNLVSNVAMKGTMAVKNAVARTIEDIAPIENKTKTWKPVSQEIKNYASKTALEMKDIISGDSKYSETADIKAKRKTFNSNFMNWLTGTNSNVLEVEDWLFSKSAFESSFREFLTANRISTEQDIQNNPELIEKGKQYAVEQAQISTFRQYSWLANKIRDIENKNAATQIAVGAVLPFKKTPINIAKTGLNYSPLGFIKSLTYDVSQVKKGNMEASTLIDHLAQNTTGTALTLVGYMLAQAGFLNGAGDDDKEGKYDYQLGKQAYSINIGGNTYSLSWLSPVAMPLFVGANAYEQLVEGEEWNADVVLETLGQTLDPLSEMSFLSSLDSVLSSYDSGVQRFFGIGEAMLQNYATQFVPTASSQLAATLDDTKRTTKVSGDSTMKVLEETYNKLIYKIPGLRETLEPTTDIWGNEIKQNENLFARAFENFIAPYARKDSIATEIDEELKDLYGQTGDTGLLPNIPSNYVKYDGERYDMSAEEYTDYKKMYGQTANDLLEDLFRTTTYKNATSEERADMVNDVYDYARDEAKLDYLAKEGVDYTNATEDKVEVYKENLIKGAIENDMTTEEYGLYLDDPEEYKFLMEKDYEYRQQYFDTYDSLKELDESFEEQKEGIDDDDELDTLYSEKKAGIVDKIINSGLDDTEKASLYKKYYNSDTVDTIMKSAISIDDYLVYTTKEFKADKNEKGNSIPGSRKDKVIDYVNTLDMSIGQKAILIKSTNTFKFNDYNEQIVRYVDGLGLSYDEVVSILKDLDMTVDDEGNVYWD